MSDQNETVNVSVSDGCLNRRGEMIIGSHWEAECHPSQSVNDVLSRLCLGHNEDVFDEHFLVFERDGAVVRHDASLRSLGVKNLFLTLMQR